MTLHSPTENSLAVLNHKIFEANPQVQNVKLGSHGTCLSINRLWHELIDCNLVAFIVFEGFHQPIKRTKQSVFLDVTVFRHTLVD
ncbi:hypothetical protein TNCV_191171 [Trichonephila clavipes]|nr:hypothetical protein TNCV_191171 [Trichonephila clavipes]